MAKILLVDDDADLLESLSCFLESHGFRILKAHNGREGLKLAKMERPDLIILDIMMDERTEGFFTVQEMRRTPGLEQVPIFILTSLYDQAPDFGIQPQSAWLGHDEFFSKPANLPVLLARIRERLGIQDQTAPAPEKEA